MERRRMQVQPISDARRSSTQGSDARLSYRMPQSQYEQLITAVADVWGNAGTWVFDSRCVLEDACHNVPFIVLFPAR